MKEVNLRKYYPFYTEDVIVSVPDEIAELLAEFDRSEDAYRIRTYRHKAMLSLDLLNEICEVPSTELLPEEIVEQQNGRECLYQGLITLPDKQRRRIIAHYFMGLNKVEIAHIEGCDPAAVVRSIDRGKAALKVFLKKIN